MKKRTVGILLATFFALALTGCGDKQPQPGEVKGYDKGEEYLYENYISLDEIGESGNMTIESKFRFLDEVIEIYEQFFPYFQTIPAKSSIHFS